MQNFHVEQSAGYQQIGNKFNQKLSANWSAVSASCVLPNLLT